MSLRLPHYVLVALLVASSGTATAARVEAVPGKKYELTKSQGPWMIMAASFQAASEDGVVREGKSPQQAADELVLELREKGLEAFVFMHRPKAEAINTRDRLGREETRVTKAAFEQVCVMVGNYGDVNDDSALKALKWIKNYKPRCLREGVLYIPTPRQPGPLSGAFLTINPMLSPQEVMERRRDPLLVKLNSGNEYSLYENPGKCTLVVATFTGKSVTELGQGKTRNEHFDNFEVGSELYEAGESAWELCVALRSQGIDAYHWHTRYESYVTVGSFDSKNDPTIARYVKEFGPQPEDPSSPNGKTVPRFATLPPKNRGERTRIIVYDTTLRLVGVPQVN